jgi:hypothetical protein
METGLNGLAGWPGKATVVLLGHRVAHPGILCAAVSLILIFAE